jgi:hypothetical protein
VSPTNRNIKSSNAIPSEASFHLRIEESSCLEADVEKSSRGRAGLREGVVHPMVGDHGKAQRVRFYRHMIVRATRSVGGHETLVGNHKRMDRHNYFMVLRKEKIRLELARVLLTQP